MYTTTDLQVYRCQFEDARPLERFRKAKKGLIVDKFVSKPSATSVKVTAVQERPCQSRQRPSSTSCLPHWPARGHCGHSNPLWARWYALTVWTGNLWARWYADWMNRQSVGTVTHWLNEQAICGHGDTHWLYEQAICGHGDTLIEWRGNLWARWHTLTVWTGNLWARWYADWMNRQSVGTVTHWLNEQAICGHGDTHWLYEQAICGHGDTLIEWRGNLWARWHTLIEWTDNLWARWHTDWMNRQSVGTVIRTDCMNRQSAGTVIHWLNEEAICGHGDTHWTGNLWARWHTLNRQSVGTVTHTEQAIWRGLVADTVSLSSEGERNLVWPLCDWTNWLY